ncbi:hypothetical protein Tco_0576683 [Tanacetum coccineum]
MNHALPWQNFRHDLIPNLKFDRFMPHISITLLSVTSSLHSASNLDDLLGGFMNDLWTSELAISNLGPVDS